MSQRIAYIRSAEKPDLQVWWYDDDGNLVDFSSGVVSWSLKIGQVGQAAALTKTTGITGAAGSGTPGSGTPNVAIVWATNELNLTPGAYTLQLNCVTTDGDRVEQVPIEIRGVIT